jgi:carbonic anhydrase
MEKLVQGIHHCQSSIFSSQRELFGRLAGGQSPIALSITCSDSRINPNLITQTDPGEVFVYDPAQGQFVPLPAKNLPTPFFAFALAADICNLVACLCSQCGCLPDLLLACLAGPEK